MSYYRKDWLSYYLGLFQLQASSIPLGVGGGVLGNIFQNLYTKGMWGDPGKFFEEQAEKLFDTPPFLDPSAFFSQLQTTYSEQFLSYSKGLQSYFEAALPTFSSIGKQVFASQGTSLYEVASRGEGVPLLLMSPLLLKPQIFRLCDTHDFLNDLVEAGFRPFILDVGVGETAVDSFETFCAKQVFPAYGFLLGHLSQAPYILSCWEAVFWTYALFEKQFPFKGGMLLGEPPLFNPTQHLPFWNVLGEALIQPMLKGGYGVGAPFVRFLLSLQNPAGIIEKITKVGTYSTIPPQFAAAEDLFNQPRFMPPWLADLLSCGKALQDFFPLNQAFLKHFELMPPEKSQFWQGLLNPTTQDALNVSSGNYGLMIGSAAPSEVWPKVLQRIHKQCA